MKKKYTNYCFKCGVRFYTHEELDTDRPTCNRCFSYLVNKVKTPRQYYKFLKSSSGFHTFMKIVILFVSLIVGIVIGLNLNLRSQGFKPLCIYAGGKYTISWDNPKGWNVASCLLKR